VPVIVLASADADPVDRVRAFERGADDVVERHLYPELVARIHALVRRSASGLADIAEVGDLVVDHRARQVRIGAVVIRLSGREFDLAARLASDPRRVFSKEELLKDLWGHHNGRFVTRTVDSHASRLRGKLRAVTGDDRFVVNVWGRGYRLIE
jgi:two-component system response regulator MtrA